MKNYIKAARTAACSIHKSHLLASAFVALLVSFNSSAQSDWSAAVGGQFGFSKLDAQNSNFTSGTEPGVGLLLDVSYALSSHISIQSGLGYSYLQSGATLATYKDQQAAIDVEGEPFDFNYSLSNYSETQQMGALIIPLTVQYETSGDTRFYARTGVSYTAFMNPTVKAKATDLNTTGYFERFNATLDRPLFAGFGSFDDIAFSKQDLVINNSINATLEMGVKEKMGTGQWLYVGAFVDYGLTDLKKETSTSLVSYNSQMPTDFIINSSLNAVDQSTNRPFTDSINFFMVGLKLRYAFDL